MAQWRGKDSGQTAAKLGTEGVWEFPEMSIGDHAKIGANAVVLCDVPSGATAVGVPAKIIYNNPNKTSDNMD